MTAADARKRHAELVAKIRHHDHLYYVEARPAVSDFEYDQLYQALLDVERQFPELVTPDSPSQRVGGTPTKGFVRIKHLQPMLSLEKIESADHPTPVEEPDREKRNRAQDENTVEGLRAFDRDIRKKLGREDVQYIIEPKVDGVSIGVHYRDGQLALGATRGDGQTGDDITVNLRTVRAIPLKLEERAGSLPELLEVRGEAYMSIADFEKLNARVETAGDKPFPNARNATAGALKQLDPKLVAQRPIRAVFYGVGACEGIAFGRHSDMLERLKQFGLPTQPVWWVCDGIDEVLRVYREEIVNDYDERRDLRTRVPYEIDGLVLKVNTMADWTRIPAKTRSPGYAIVHKPVHWITPAETLLKAITVQVGRTGVLTPVAELEPVFVQGSTISRATLHNEDEICRKDIRIGDTVVVRKAGMVIPEVFEVVKTKRPADAKEFDLFEHVGGKCPACGAAITKSEVKVDSAGEPDDGRAHDSDDRESKSSAGSGPSGGSGGPGSLGEEIIALLAAGGGAGEGLGGMAESERQQRQVRQWAKRRGCLIEEGGWLALQPVSHGSAEHEVRFRPTDGRAVKRTHPGTFGFQPVQKEGTWISVAASPLAYLIRFQLQNELFGDDVRLEGVMESAGPSMVIGQTVGGLSLVISQSWLEAGDTRHPHPTERAVADFFAERGFRRIKDAFYGWQRLADGVIVLDARPDNFIATAGGIFPIDLHLHVPLAAGEALDENEINVVWRCPNINCPAQLTRRVEYFAARKALDIESLGGIVAEKLVERGLVKEPLDLFALKVEQLAKLNLGTDEEPRTFGEKNATKVIEALERAKGFPLDRWIFALAVPNVGDTIAWQLAQAHHSLAQLADSAVLRDIRDQGALDAERKEISPRSRKNPPKDEAERALREARYDELGRELKTIEERLSDGGLKARMVEVGPVVAGSVLEFFASVAGQALLARLKELGIDPRSERPVASPVAARSPIAGKTFVLTGTLPTLARDEASKLIRDAGGSTSSSVSKNTDYVLAGEEAGSKLEKAQKLGVKVIDEREFLEMLDRKNDR